MQTREHNKNVLYYILLMQIIETNFAESFAHCVAEVMYSYNVMHIYSISSFHDYIFMNHYLEPNVQMNNQL